MLSGRKSFIGLQRRDSGRVESVPEHQVAGPSSPKRNSQEHGTNEEHPMRSSSDIEVRKVAIGLVGAGLVGSALLDQLRAQVMPLYARNLPLLIRQVGLSAIAFNL